MSILNYFGKIKSKYEPFEYPYVYKGNLCGHRKMYNGNITHLEGVNGIILAPQDNAFSYNFMRRMSSVNEFNSNISISNMFTTDSYYVNNINDIFQLVLDKINEMIIGFQTITKDVIIAPPLNIFEILILKISGLDLHVKHLDKMNKTLIDDMKTLQNKLISIENQINLYKKEKDKEKEIKKEICIAEAVLC